MDNEETNTDFSSQVLVEKELRRAQLEFGQGEIFLSVNLLAQGKNRHVKSIFLLGHLLSTEDQLNLLLGLGSIGYVLYGTSSQVLNEGSFTKMKGKERLIVGIVFAREQPV